MEIVKYVAELLQFHKEVGIDGFGTIYKKKSPGRYDSESRSFLPPGSTTAFTKEITESTLLINHLEKQENVSRDVAADAISRFAISLSQQLSEKGYAPFDPIGVLSVSNGQILLAQNPNFKPGMEFFGLPRIDEPVTSEPQPEQPLPIPLITPIIPVMPIMPEEVTREEEDATLEEKVVSENLLEEENPGKETNEPLLNQVRKPFVENTIKYTIKEDKPKEGSSLLLKVALILLGLLVLSIAIYFLYPRASSSFTEEPTTPAVNTDSTRADSLNRIAREKAILDSAFQADSLKNAQLKMQRPPVVDSIQTVLPADTATTYEVIGASVLNQKEASWFIETMKKSGIKAKVVHNAPGKRLKMSIATLKDESTAKAVRDRLSEKLKIKGLYIFKNKTQ